MKSTKVIWTDEEKELLKEHYPSGDYDDLKKLFSNKFTSLQIACKANKLGIHKREGFVLRPYTHKNIPVGNVFKRKNGTMAIKVSKGSNGWVRLSAYVWKEHHGEYPPKGDIIAFKDGDKSNCDISNLILVTRLEQFAKVRISNLPQELKEVVYLRRSLIRKINERE